MACNEFFKVFQHRAIKVGSLPLDATNTEFNSLKWQESSKRAKAAGVGSCIHPLLTRFVLWERAGRCFGCCCEAFPRKMENVDFGVEF